MHPPHFVIKIMDHFQSGASYGLHCEHNGWGDFLTLRQQPEEGQQNSTRQIMVINLWAVFSVQCMRVIASDGSMTYVDNQVVRPARSGADAGWPFCMVGLDDRGRSVEQFMKSSREFMDTLVRPNESRYGNKLSGIESIDRMFFADRGPNLTAEEANRQMRELVAKLFP